VQPKNEKTEAYPVPAKPVQAEQTIKRSRFIAMVNRTKNPAEATAFIERVRSTYPDARHHCWAYVAGNPLDTRHVAMSDDGEPSGTAGKPILSVLQHSGIGEITAVVTRYFGGIKLGTGGLVRAYTGVVQAALKILPLATFHPVQSARIVCPYPQEDTVRRLLDNLGIPITHVSYTHQVEIAVEVPLDMAEELSGRLGDQTRGEAAVHPSGTGDRHTGKR